MISILIAQSIGNPALDFPATTTGVSFIQALIPALINLGFVAGAVFFLFNAIIGAIKWTSSGGDKTHLEEAKSQVTHAVIGIFILLAVYAIVSLVETFFGVNLRQFDLGKLRIVSSGGIVVPPDGTGNPNCPGCVTGGCGITGNVYLGSGTQHYLCTDAGWVPTSSTVSSTTCGTCN